MHFSECNYYSGFALVIILNCPFNCDPT